MGSSDPYMSYLCVVCAVPESPLPKNEVYLVALFFFSFCTNNMPLVNASSACFFYMYVHVIVSNLLTRIKTVVFFLVPIKGVCKDT